MQLLTLRVTHGKNDWSTRKHIVQLLQRRSQIWATQATHLLMMTSFSHTKTEYRSSMPTFSCCSRTVCRPSIRRSAQNSYNICQAMLLNCNVSVPVRCFHVLPVTGTRPTSHEQQVKVPFWLCHGFWTCVLCGAVPRTTGFLATSYLDALRCTMISLFHREIGVDAGSYMLMMRLWFCGVGDSRTEKSITCSGSVQWHCPWGVLRMGVFLLAFFWWWVPPCAFPNIRCFWRRNAWYVRIWTVDEQWRFSNSCPTYPSRCVFDESNGLVSAKMIDTAYGKQLGGETKYDRRDAKEAKEERGAHTISVVETYKCVSWDHYTRLRVDCMVGCSRTATSRRLRFTFSVLVRLWQGDWEFEVRAILHRFLTHCQESSTCCALSVQSTSCYLWSAESSSRSFRLLRRTRATVETSQSCSWVGSTRCHCFQEWMCTSNKRLSVEITILGQLLPTLHVVHITVPQGAIAASTCSMSLRYCTGQRDPKKCLSFCRGRRTLETELLQIDANFQELLAHCAGNAVTQTSVASCSPDHLGLLARNVRTKKVAQDDLRNLSVRVEDTILDGVVTRVRIWDFNT